MAAMAALTSLLAIYLLSSRGLVPLRGRTVYATLALLAISSAGLMGCVGLNSAQPNPSSVTVTAISGGVSKILTVPISIK